MKQIAICYAEGHGVAKNINQCVYWLQKGYDKQDLESYFLLSQILCDGGLNGHDDGYPKDAKRAYVLGRTLQLISGSSSISPESLDSIVMKARQDLQADALIDAETQAQEEVKS